MRQDTTRQGGAGEKKAEDHLQYLFAILCFLVRVLTTFRVSEERYKRQEEFHCLCSMNEFLDRKKGQKVENRVCKGGENFPWPRARRSLSSS